MIESSGLCECSVDHQCPVEPQPIVDRWRKRLVRFLLRCSGLSVEDKLIGKTIALPSPVSQERHAPEKAVVEGERHLVMPLGETISRDVACERISSLFAPQDILSGISFAPTHREADAFRMKAITMIRNYGFPSTSLGEVLQAVRLAPLRPGSADALPTDGESSDATVVTFQQTLEPFPGETIILEGSFRRNAQDKVVSVPIPDSFRLYSKSSQTGFPHPLQHNGWGLCDKVLPPFPDAIERTPLYRLLHDHKRKVALGLLPSGRHLAQAKRILQVKRSLYEAHQSELLALHHHLAQALSALSTEQEGKDGLAIVDALFTHLGGCTAAIESIALVYATVDDFFMTQPSEAIQAFVVAVKSQPEEMRYEQASDRLQRIMTTCEVKFVERVNDLPVYLRDYTLFLGQLMKAPATEIILQYMSEKMGYRSQPLSPLAMRIQINALRQLMTFLVDVELDFEGAEQETTYYIYDRIVHSLEEDIACFEEPVLTQTAKSAACVAKELGSYYSECRLS